MTRKIITATAITLLFTAFAVVSLLVVVTKRHPFFIEKKLHIGALILTLSTFTAGCRGAIGPEVMCYDPGPSNVITIDNAHLQADTIIVNKTLNPAISGIIEMRSGSTFSYAITDTSRTFTCKENLQPCDGAFDESTEEFSIPIAHQITPGEYQLHFFASPKDSLKNDAWKLQTFSLVVTE